MSYVEQVEKTFEERLESLKKAVEDEHQMIGLRRRLAEIFDEETAEVKPVSDWIGRRFEFRFRRIEEARAFTDALLEKLSIEKAEKGFEGWGEHPMWSYNINIEGQEIKIEPAEPSSECKPVPVASSTMHWVCEKI